MITFYVENYKKYLAFLAKCDKLKILSDEGEENGNQCEIQKIF